MSAHMLAMARHISEVATAAHDKTAELDAGPKVTRLSIVRRNLKKDVGYLMRQDPSSVSDSQWWYAFEGVAEDLHKLAKMVKKKVP